MVFRMGGDGPKRITVNYDDIILHGAEDFELQPGDTIGSGDSPESHWENGLSIQ